MFPPLPTNKKDKRRDEFSRVSAMTRLVVGSFIITVIVANIFCIWASNHQPTSDEEAHEETYSQPNHEANNSLALRSQRFVVQERNKEAHDESNKT